MSVCLRIQHTRNLQLLCRHNKLFCFIKIGIRHQWNKRPACRHTGPVSFVARGRVMQRSHLVSMYGTRWALMWTHSFFKHTHARIRVRCRCPGTRSLLPFFFFWREGGGVIFVQGFCGFCKKPYGFFFGGEGWFLSAFEHPRNLKSGVPHPLRTGCHRRSSCPQPPPPRATAGNLPAMSVPGVGHLQILRCPGAGHLPTPSFWHAHGFLSEYNYTEDFTGKITRLAHLSRTGKNWRGL